MSYNHKIIFVRQHPAEDIEKEEKRTGKRKAADFQILCKLVTGLNRKVIGYLKDVGTKQYSSTTPERENLQEKILQFSTKDS